MFVLFEDVGDINTHNSMMVNVSRFTGIQSAVRNLIYGYLEDLRSSIAGHYALSTKEALKNKTILRLKNIYDKEYSEIEINWDSIQKELHNVRIQDWNN